MTSIVLLVLFPVVVVAGVAMAANRFWSRRQAFAPPPLADKLSPRRPLSIALSVISAFALCSGAVVGTFRRNMDVYATELRILAAVMAAGLLAALANRYFYRRWL